MWVVGKAGPVAAPFEVGELRERKCGELFIGIDGCEVFTVLEQANVPGNAEVVVAAATAGISDTGLFVAVTAFAVERILFCIGAGAGDDPYVKTAVLTDAKKLAGKHLNLWSERNDVCLASGIEAAILVGDLLARLVELFVGSIGLRPPDAVKLSGIKAISFQKALVEKLILFEKLVAHVVCILN